MQAYLLKKRRKTRNGRKGLGKDTKELAWIQHQTTPQQHLLKMELLKEHWQKAKVDNENLVLQSKMQIVMAERILVLIREKLAEFPEEKK